MRIPTRYDKQIDRIQKSYEGLQYLSVSHEDLRELETRWSDIEYLGQLYNNTAHGDVS